VEDERHRPTSRDVKPASGGTLVIEVPPLVIWRVPSPATWPRRGGSRLRIFC